MQPLLYSQQKAVTKLRQYKVGALFMEPGTGKTRTAYELQRSVNPDYLLYLAPYQAINQSNHAETVPAEVERCGGFAMPHDFIGFESLSASDRIYLDILKKLNRASRPFIIADESLKIKNWEAKRTKRIVAMSQLAEHKLVLNGTPLSRNLLDLHSQFEFLSPKILRMGMAEFKNTFCEYTVMKKRVGRSTLTREWINRYHNLDYLYKLIGPFVFESNLEIDPKIQYIDIPFNLSSEEKDTHEYLKEKYLDNDRMELRNNNIFLEITQKLQHNYSLSAEKFEAVDFILGKRDPRKVLLVAKYIDSQEALRQYFPRVRVLSWQKHSYSMNMQDYNCIVKWDKHWDYALHKQLKHRVYRTGQKDDCFIYNLTGNVGLENMMNDNEAKKGYLLDAFCRKSVEELQKEL